MSGRVNIAPGTGYDLFSYPQAAGWKRTDTSFQAAERVDAGLLRAKVLRAIREAGPLTADECADYLDLSILSIRPRCTELRKLGRLRDTEIRRPNASGRNAIVWAASD